MVKEKLSVETLAKTLNENLVKSGQASVDKEALEQALKDTKESLLAGCDSCANGWHW
jgi:hypothetical protein